MMNENIAYCGVDCSICSDFTEMKCPGCRQTDWKSDDICMPVRCCQEKGIACCGECSCFPCGEMKAFYEESESHKKAFIRMNYEIIPLTEEEERFIEEKINEYADSMAPAEPHTEEEQLVFMIADKEGSVIGGCVVNIHAWGRAVLAQLWVDEHYRRHGLGSMLIRAAENAAREKGCYYLCLGTQDFMARPLYEKHGFQVFTVNNDFPSGHVSWSMAKRLDHDIPVYIPTDNSAGEKFKVEPGSREAAKIIDEGLGRYCDQFVAADETDDIPFNRKLVDKDSNIIAAVLAEIDSDQSTNVNGIWVQETYRNQGIGSYLLDLIEYEAKKNSSYIMLSNACDWNVAFFQKNGYVVRGELEDYPKGHMAYEIEKRI